MLVKKNVVYFIGLALGTFGIAANAGNLVITNNTNQDSTTKTNGSVKCSSQILGEMGITRKHKSNTIWESLLKTACAGNLEKCTAYVYMDDHCGGSPAAFVTFSVTRGLLGAPVIYDKAYSLGGSGFNLTILGGHGRTNYKA